MYTTGNITPDSDHYWKYEIGEKATAVTLIWALSLLLNNREALEKAKAELDAQKIFTAVLVAKHCNSAKNWGLWAKHNDPKMPQKLF